MNCHLTKKNKLKRQKPFVVFHRRELLGPKNEDPYHHRFVKKNSGTLFKAYRITTNLVIGTEPPKLMSLEF